MNAQVKIETFLKDLNTLAKTNTLEYTFEEKTKKAYIPFMMNDALECYYCLLEVSSKGSFDFFFAKDEDGWSKDQHELTREEETSIEYIAPGADNKKHCILIRQGSKEVISVWFTHVTMELSCYEHHRIGHFWVTGSEQLRQLVYIIATIYDKYLFLPDELADRVLNEKERKLLPLVEFAPFRYWYPVKDDIFGRYPDTEEGALFAQELAAQCGLKRLKRLTGLYRKLFFGRYDFPASLEVFLNYPLTAKIARELNHKRSIPFYLKVWELVKDACASYPKRVYDPEYMEQMEAMRQDTENKLLSIGYTGSYPFFKRESGSTFEWITACEEHPFTRLERDFPFRIQLMYSQTRDKSSKDQPNAGFFTGPHHQGMILSPEDYIKEENEKEKTTQ